MAVCRVEKTKNYTVMANYHLRDKRLSLKAVGLLSKMLSLPEEWDYTTRGLAAICKDGVDAIGAALKELENCGYLVRHRLRDDRGRMRDTEYVIYESPHTALPDTENPYLDNPDTICFEHQLSVIENPKRHGKSYNKWLGDKAKPSQRELLRTAIDTALEKHPDTIDELWIMLQEAGYEVKRRGKTVSLQAPNHKAPARLSSLGEGYSESDLLAILAGEKAHTPRKKAAVLEAPKPSLLIDIQAKLDAGKGTGYEQWAKVFNIKQIAQTINFLRENSGMDYDELVRQTDAAAARFNTLSAQIKAAETRMAEIAVLKTQVINYAKTRKIFDGYKASRYSKKYLAEHEADILLHRAAKKTFNDMQLKKLPTVKSLQAEYAALLSEKKAAYSEYRQARDEMKKLLVYRANAEKILGKDVFEAEKEKEQGQR